MTARKDMFSIWCEKVEQAEEENKSKYLLEMVDFLVNNYNLRDHTNTKTDGEQCLPSEESIPDAVCLKQTSHVAAIIGGLMMFHNKSLNKHVSRCRYSFCSFIMKCITSSFN